MMLEALFAQKLLGKTDQNTEEARECLKKMYALFKQGHLALTQEQIGLPLTHIPASLISDKGPFVQYQNLYYLHKNWVYETRILQHMQRLRSLPFPKFFDSSKIQQGLLQLAEQNLCLPEQIQALKAASSHLFSVICGGPGTGKTYVASHLVALLVSALIKDQKPSLRICLAAPTGKASSHLHKVLQTKTGNSSLEFTTIHRLLQIHPNHPTLQQNRIIDADIVIVDEASMIDVPMLAALLASIGKQTLLVLIGDPNQLPPVETSSLFAEIGDVLGVFLKHSMRVEGKLLQQLTTYVKNGFKDLFFALLKENNPVCQWHEPSLKKFLDFDLLYQKINPIQQTSKPDPMECFEKYRKFRIINALRQGPFGSDVLNQTLFQRLKRTNQWWAAPILSTRNDPHSHLYNGTEGILIGYGMEKPTAYFPEAKIPTPPFEIAFCISIHKAQGSEFDETLALFPQGSENFGRASLYTGITRSKKKIDIWGTKETLEAMIRGHFRPVSGLSKRFNEQL